MELTEIFSLAPIGSICIETFGTVVYQKIGESEFVPHSEATIDLNESVARYKKLTEEYEAQLIPVEEPLVEPVDIDLTLIERKKRK